MSAILEFKSDDAGAPVLNNATGALIALLDACLVTGYGTRVAAGWSKLAGVNVAAYQAPAGRRFFLRVDDTGVPGNAATTSARVVGYESMTDASAGVNPFPTAAQTPSGFHIPKTNTMSSATARPWRLYADDRRFWLITDVSAVYPLGTQGEAVGSLMRASFFGDIVDFGAADLYGCLLLADSANGTGSGSISSPGLVNQALSTTQARVARDYAGAVLSAQVGIGCAVTPSAANASGGFYCGAYPAPGTDGLELQPMYVTDTNGVPRGKLPGACGVDAYMPEAVIDELVAANGITYLLVDSVGFSARVALQITGEWT